MSIKSIVLFPFLSSSSFSDLRRPRQTRCPAEVLSSWSSVAQNAWVSSPFPLKASSALMGGMIAPILVLTLGVVRALTAEGVFQVLPMGARMLLSNCSVLEKGNGRLFTLERKAEIRVVNSWKH